MKGQRKFGRDITNIPFTTAMRDGPKYAKNKYVTKKQSHFISQGGGRTAMDENRPEEERKTRYVSEGRVNLLTKQQRRVVDIKDIKFARGRKATPIETIITSERMKRSLSINSQKSGSVT